MKQLPLKGRKLAVLIKQQQKIQTSQCLKDNNKDKTLEILTFKGVYHTLVISLFWKLNVYSNRSHHKVNSSASLDMCGKCLWDRSLLFCLSKVVKTLSSSGLPVRTVLYTYYNTLSLNLLIFDCYRQLDWKKNKKTNCLAMFITLLSSSMTSRLNCLDLTYIVKKKKEYLIFNPLKWLTMLCSFRCL